MLVEPTCRIFSLLQKPVNNNDGTGSECRVEGLRFRGPVFLRVSGASGPADKPWQSKLYYINKHTVGHKISTAA